MDMYKQADEHELYRYLKNKGISHVFISGYSPATLYNSPAQRVFGNPAYAYEVKKHKGHRLLRLTDKPENGAARVTTSPETGRSMTAGSDLAG